MDAALFDIQNQLFVVKRLENVVVSAFLHGLDSFFDRAMGGHHNHRKISIGYFYIVKQFDSVHGRHFHVCEHQVHIRLGQDI